MFLKYTGFLNLNDVGTNVVEPPLSVDVLICAGCKYLLPSGTILGPGVPLITSLICKSTPFVPEAGFVLKYNNTSLKYIPPGMPSTVNVCARGSPKPHQFQPPMSIGIQGFVSAGGSGSTSGPGPGSGSLLVGVSSVGGCGPGCPVSPVGPDGPVLPTGPVGPVCPTGPGLPTGPGGPTISIVSCITTGAGGGGRGVPVPIEISVETSVTTLLSVC